MKTYPKRPSHFAHRFVRLMMKAVAAQEVGPEGFCLLAAIAMTEDAKRYRGAVVFFNQPLMAVCGFTSEKVLFRVRQRCVDAGWLVWNHGRKGVAATYWVAIPEQHRCIEDGPVDEVAPDFNSQVGAIPDQSAEELGTNREVIGNQLGTNREPIGQTFLPNPSPLVPSPLSQKPVVGFGKVRWWKGLNATHLADDSKIDVLHGAAIAGGFAEEGDEERARFAALVFNVRRSKAKKPFGLFTRILEGKVRNKYAAEGSQFNWRTRAVEQDYDTARRALKALDGLGVAQPAAAPDTQAEVRNQAARLAEFQAARAKRGKAAS